ncbi:MAG TPA: MBL fold metallo-hydrolase [Longimicrobium sp.]|nr:MBL fold metallo-hydrolase [Longimicrobium sp.]
MPNRLARVLPLLAGLAAAGGCTMNLRQVEGPDASAVPTFWPYQSLVFAARTADGVFVVDLGWSRGGRALRRTLAAIGARPEDVTDVFLTHGHRDHIMGWPAVRHARFHLMQAEVPLFLGQLGHADLPSRAARAAVGDVGPWPGEVDVRPFSGDTAFVLGADTIRAFVVPGHTPGSTAYLYRGVLFAGDAISRPYHTGFGPGMGIFTTDRAANRAALASLFERIRPYDVRWVCTAHGKCARPDERFIRKVLR